MARKNKQTKKKTMSQALVPYVPQAANIKGPKAQKAKAKKKSASLPQFPAAQFDPFADCAVGVKVPDENTMPSVTNYNRQEFGMQTDSTNGGSVLMVRSTAKSVYVGSTVNSVNSWTAPTYAAGGTADCNSLAGMQTAYDLYRTVAYGVKLSCRLSPNNVTGMIHVGIVPENFTVSASWDMPINVSQMLKLPFYRCIPLADLINEPLFVQGRFQDYSGFQYRTPTWVPGTSTASAITTSFGWSNVFIFVEGAPVNGEVVRVETIHHFEGLLSYSNSGLQSETAAAPYSPMVMAATKNAVESRDPARVANGLDLADEPTFWDDCVKAYNSGLKVATGVYKVIAPLAAMLL